MVLIEHVGFGGRDRQLWMYFWDERDGAEWSGWWITPDFIGNTDFFLHHRGAPDTPADAPLGSWRSHFVEEQQLKRQLELGFEAVKGADGVLCTRGADAGFTFVPDGVCKIKLGGYEWRPDGMNHGRPAYQAFESSAAEAAAVPVAPQLVATPVKIDSPTTLAGLHPAIYVAMGVAAGIACTVALMRASR